MLVVALGVALSPVALDMCAISCDSPNKAPVTAHHACHSDATTRLGSQTCGHDHGSVADAIIRADHAENIRPVSTVTAVLPIVAARLTLALIAHTSSPPRSDGGLTSVAASALPLRV